MILDTNALTALAARDPTIIAKLEAADSLAFSFICVAEFQYGLLGSKRPEAGHELLRIMSTRIPILYPDSSTSDHYAAIAHDLKRRGRPIPRNDIWTAALSRQHQLPVVSRDRHFDFVTGIERVSW